LGNITFLELLASGKSVKFADFLLPREKNERLK